MKLVGRMLWLLLGLLYRLIVLVLFEKWIPFPDRPLSAPQPAAEQEREQAKQKASEAAASAQPERMAKPQRGRRGRAFEPALFATPSRELPRELAAQHEGEHWVLHPDQRLLSLARGPAHFDRVRAQPRRHETLSGLLRDKRALRDALVLGTALAVRRPRS